MKEQIFKIMRRSSLSDQEKLKEIFNLLQEDDSKFYWINNLVKLTHIEFDKLNTTYWTVAINHMIIQLDWYIYTKWKKYKSHYITLIKWLDKAWANKIKPMYQCSYWLTHYVWEDCKCSNF